MVITDVRSLNSGDWQDVLRIYKQGIQSGMATLETEIPDWQVWDSEHLKDPRFVAITDHRTVGWIALTPVSGRCVYGGVGEISVYVDSEDRGRGIGKLLLQKATRRSEELGYWTLQAGILEENIASIRLHQSCGFRVVGVRERLGRLNGQWKNIVLMERRSPIVGT